MDPSYFESLVQAAGGAVVSGIFSWNTFGSLVPTEHPLKTSHYLSIVADHVLYRCTAKKSAAIWTKNL